MAKSYFPCISQAKMYFYSLGQDFSSVAKMFCLRQKSFCPGKKNNFVQAEGWSISVTKGICKMLAQGTQPDVYLSIISLPCQVELDPKSRFINGNFLVKLVFQDNLSRN